MTQRAYCADCSHYRKDQRGLACTNSNLRASFAATIDPVRLEAFMRPEPLDRCSLYQPRVKGKHGH